MITQRLPDGKVKKWKIREFRKYYAEKNNELIYKKIIDALKKNLHELSSSGHDIMMPSYYVSKVGLPDEYIHRFAHKHFSDYRYHTSTLYNADGSLADYIFGVNNLTILESLCSVVGWDDDLYKDYVRYNGRGRIAGVCYENLVKRLNFKFPDKTDQ